MERELLLESQQTGDRQWSYCVSRALTLISCPSSSEWHHPGLIGRESARRQWAGRGAGHPATVPRAETPTHRAGRARPPVSPGDAGAVREGAGPVISALLSASRRQASRLPSGPGPAACEIRLHTEAGILGHGLSATHPYRTCTVTHSFVKSIMQYSKS